MNKLFFLLSFLFVIIACQSNQGYDYNQSVEDFDLTEFTFFDDTNPFEGAQSLNGDSKVAALGRVLFYDTRLSLNNSVSCGTCHHQDKGFSDGQVLSKGLFNENTERNTVSLANLAYQNTHFWNTQGRDLDEDVLQPVSNHLEMGIEKLEKLPAKLQKYEGYSKLFLEAYQEEGINEEKIGKALASFLNAMISNQSKFDDGLRNDFLNFTDIERAGMDLFNGKANCNKCHEEPIFSRNWGSAQNIGIPGESDTDIGAGLGKYKIPTLRNIELTAPYMHNGAYETLMDVIEHYDNGVEWSPGLSWWLRASQDSALRLNLTSDEKESLVAFLKTLTDHEYLVDERFSNPFK